MILKPCYCGTGQTVHMLPTQLETGGDEYRASLDVPGALLIL